MGFAENFGHYLVLERGFARLGCLNKGPVGIYASDNKECCGQRALLQEGDFQVYADKNAQTEKGGRSSPTSIASKI